MKSTLRAMQHAVVSTTVSALLLTLFACSSKPPNPAAVRAAAQVANAGNFSTTYFLGDSLTAGFQSGSLISTSQVNGWAPLVAAQAKFPIVLPLIASPGAPSQLTLLHLANPPLLSTIAPLPGTSTGRVDFSVQPTDVAVPGALVNDVLNTLPQLLPLSGQQILNQQILGFPGFSSGVADSQAQLAARANPTTIFVWIGNNDALVADFTGSPASMTPLATFTTQYQQLIGYLTANTNAHLIIANVPDVTAVPYLQSATVLLGFFSAQTGVPASVLSGLLGIVPGDLVGLPGVQQVPAILGGKAKGPISAANILHAADAATVRANVVAYNQVIAASASAAGATLVDINAVIAAASANGIAINGVTGNTSFLGGLFSLDGIHPTNTGYAIIANAYIDSINNAFKTSIPDVNLVTVAAADPLFPPYPGHLLVKPPVEPNAIPVIHLSGERVGEILGKHE